MTDFSQPPPADTSDDELTELAPSPVPRQAPRRAATEQLPAVRFDPSEPDDELSEGTEPGSTAPRQPAPRRSATEPLLPRIGGAPAQPRLRPLPAPAVDPWAAAIHPSSSPVSPAPARVARPDVALEDHEDTGVNERTAPLSRAELAAAMAQRALPDDEDTGADTGPRTAPLSRAELAPEDAAYGEDTGGGFRTSPLSRAELAAAIAPEGGAYDEDTSAGVPTALVSRSEVAAALASRDDDEDSDVGAPTVPLSRGEVAAALAGSRGLADHTGPGQRTQPLSRAELEGALGSHRAGDEDDGDRPAPGLRNEPTSPRQDLAEARYGSRPAAARATQAPSAGAASPPRDAGAHAWEIPAVASASNGTQREPPLPAASIHAPSERGPSARGPGAERHQRGGSGTPPVGRARVAANPAVPVPAPRAGAPVLSAAIAGPRGDATSEDPERTPLHRPLLTGPWRWLWVLALLGLFVGVGLGFLVD